MRIYQLLLTLITFMAVAVTPAIGKQNQPQSIEPHPDHRIIDQVLSLANNFLLQQTSNYPGQAIITIEPPKLDPAWQCSDLQAELSGSIRSNTTIRVRCLSPESWQTYVKAKVQVIGSYFVAKRLIQRDEIIGYDDVKERQGDLLKVHRAITNPDNIISWISNRRIPAGSIIDTNALRDPNSIQRGQQVRTIARGIGFTATSTGQAISSGTPGTQIQVRTPTGQIITGTVIDGQTVQVIM